MRTKYRNQLYKMIEDVSLESNDFDLLETTIEEESAIIINYKKADFEFDILCNSESFDLFRYRYTVYKPNLPITDLYPRAIYANFETVLSSFRSWLILQVHEYLSDENEIDLWSQYQDRNTDLDIEEINFNSQENFSIPERKQISMALHELKYLIHQHITESNEQQNIVNERIDYLIEATNRLNKFDWKSLVLSTILSIVTTLSLDTEKGKMIFEFFKKVFKSIPKIS